MVHNFISIFGGIKVGDFRESRTRQNLARAFAGECQDGARYQFLAMQAESEGYAFLQTIFKIHAKNEMAHAKRFYDLIAEHDNVSERNIDITGGYPFTHGSLLDQMKATIDTEKSQSDIVYPDFASIAKDEGYDDVAYAFECAGLVEDHHRQVVEDLYTKLKAGKLYKSTATNLWKCSYCGYIERGKQAWEECPSCLKPQGYCEVHCEE